MHQDTSNGGFDQVETKGIFGSDRYMEIHDEERAKLDRLLRIDPARMRRLVPVRMKQRLYDLILSRSRKVEDPRAQAITADDFFLADDGLEGCLDPVAICRGPRA